MADYFNAIGNVPPSLNWLDTRSVETPHLDDGTRRRIAARAAWKNRAALW